MRHHVPDGSTWRTPGGSVTARGCVCRARRDGGIGASRRERSVLSKDGIGRVPGSTRRHCVRGAHPVGPLVGTGRLGGSPARRAVGADARGCAPLPGPAPLRPRPEEDAADGVGRLLPPARATRRPPRRGNRRAARRRRQPGDRAAGRRAQPRHRCRQRRTRAVRLLPRAPDAREARGGLPADPPDTVRRRVGRAVPPGVVRGPHPGDAIARQLRARRGRRAPRTPPRRRPLRLLGHRAPTRRHDADSRRPRTTRVSAGSERLTHGCHVSDRSGDAADGHGRLARRTRAAEGAHARRGHLHGGARLGRPVLGGEARGSDGSERAGAGRRERVARAARAEHGAHMALQHREPVRAVLVPGEPRRRPGDGRVRARARRPLDAPHLAHPRRGALPELEARRAPRRAGGVLPAQRRRTPRSGR